MLQTFCAMATPVLRMSSGFDPAVPEAVCRGLLERIDDVDCKGAAVLNQKEEDADEQDLRHQLRQDFGKVRPSKCELPQGVTKLNSCQAPKELKRKSLQSADPA